MGLFLLLFSGPSLADDKIHVKIIREEMHDFCVDKEKATLQSANKLKVAALMENLIANPDQKKGYESLNTDSVKGLLNAQEVNMDQIYGLAEPLLEAYSLFSKSFHLFDESDLKDAAYRKTLGIQFTVAFLLLDDDLKKLLNKDFTDELIRERILKMSQGNFSKKSEILAKIRSVIMKELKSRVDKKYPMSDIEIKDAKQRALKAATPGQDEHFFRYQIILRDRMMRKEIDTLLDAANHKSYVIHIGDAHLTALKDELTKKYGAAGMVVTSEQCKFEMEFTGPRKGTRTRDY